MIPKRDEQDQNPATCEKELVVIDVTDITILSAEQIQVSEAVIANLNEIEESDPASIEDSSSMTEHADGIVRSSRKRTPSFKGRALEL
jgi:hypothetical protein